MRRLKLRPEEIIVPGGYEIGNESILKIYYRIFDKGYGDYLPPVIVTRDIKYIEGKDMRLDKALRNIYGWFRGRSGEGWFPDLIGNESIQDLVKKMITREAKSMSPDIILELDKICKRYTRFNEITRASPYFLIDGNHRTTASVLTHKPISALELQADKDLIEIREGVEKGELFEFNRPEESLRELTLSLERYFLGKEGLGGDYQIDYCRTVKERVDELVSNGNLPQYMINMYKNKSEK